MAAKGLSNMIDCDFITQYEDQFFVPLSRKEPHLFSFHRHHRPSLPYSGSLFVTAFCLNPLAFFTEPVFVASEICCHNCIISLPYPYGFHVELH